MTREPLVSALVAVYNEEQHLEQCLESLRAQSYQALEIIVADDGSTDRSAGIARRMPGVQLVSGSHRGKATAMNAGAACAAGDVLLFLDGDLYFDREYVARLVQPIVEGSAIGTCHATERVANPENAWSRCWQHRAGLPPDQRLRLSPSQLAEGSPIFRALRSDVFRSAGGFEDAGYDDDHTLYPKIRQRAVFVTEAVCYHYNSETLTQVFGQGVWGGKSVYRKFGARALLRYSPPLTLLRALRTLFRDLPGTLAIYDLTVETGIFWGVLRRCLRLGASYGR
jgi:glycosyltransferase involved in cell wall biosynthesis